MSQNQLLHAVSRLLGIASFASVFVLPGGHDFTAQSQTPPEEIAEEVIGTSPVEASPEPVPEAGVKIENVIRECLRKGKVAMGRNELEAARNEFVWVLEQNASDLTALVSLGWIAQREQLWEESESYLRRALKLSVEDGAIWLALGVAALEQDKLEAATAAFTQMVFLEPKNARARRLLGLTLGKRGWYDGAEQEIRRSLELDPDDAGAHFNLAVFYLQRRPAAVELARRHYYRARDLGFAPDSDIESQLAKVASR